MNRIWVFPLVLGAVGACFGVAALLEGVAPLLPMANFRASNVALILVVGVDLWPPISARTLLSMAQWPKVAHVFLNLMVCGAGVGALLGLIVGALDVIFNRAKPRSRSQLAKNIAWCLLYAHAVIVIDMALVYWWAVSPGVNLSRFNWVIWLPGSLWLVAILWGMIRTIATEDVLTPRVLLLKLRGSTALQS